MKTLRQFRDETDGSSTIEFLFWIPVMVGLITLAVDAVMLMNQSQTMHNLARDASRSVAVGALTPIEAEQSLTAWSANTGSTIEVIDGGDGFVTTTIRTPFTSVGNITAYFLDGTLQASAAMWIEGAVFNES